MWKIAGMRWRRIVRSGRKGGSRGDEWGRGWSEVRLEVGDCLRRG